MSLILDALRKIEQERRTRRQGVMDIRADVLNYRGNTAPPPKSRLIPLLGLTLFVIIAAVTFYILKPGQPVLEGGRITPAPTVPLPVQTATTTEPPSVVSQPTVKEPPKAAVSPVLAPKPTTSALEGDENMVISGIAWQEERSLRRVVVNGVLAGEGAEILGARIVEIREDRVLFSRSGRNFEVTYAGGAGR